MLSLTIYIMSHWSSKQISKKRKNILRFCINIGISKAVLLLKTLENFHGIIAYSNYCIILGKGCAYMKECYILILRYHWLHPLSYITFGFLYYITIDFSFTCLQVCFSKFFMSKLQDTNILKRWFDMENK